MSATCRNRCSHRLIGQGCAGLVDRAQSLQFRCEREALVEANEFEAAAELLLYKECGAELPCIRGAQRMPRQ